MDRERTLINLKEAWGRRDADAAAACFSKDAVYAASLGPDPGSRAMGRAAIRTLIAAMFKADDGAQTEIARLRMAGDGASWTWRYRLPDGSAALGCDLFEFDGALISLKDAYRKVWQPDLHQVQQIGEGPE